MTDREIKMAHVQDTYAALWQAVDAYVQACGGQAENCPTGARAAPFSQLTQCIESYAATLCKLRVTPLEELLNERSSMGDSDYRAAHAAALCAAKGADNLARASGWPFGDGRWQDEASDRLYEESAKLGKTVYQLAEELLREESARRMESGTMDCDEIKKLHWQRRKYQHACWDIERLSESITWVMKQLKNDLRDKDAHLKEEEKEEEGELSDEEFNKLMALARGVWGDRAHAIDTYRGCAFVQGADDTPLIEIDQHPRAREALHAALVAIAALGASDE